MGSTITIDFHGDPLAAILDDQRGPLVPLRPLVTGMGLDWSGQLQRVKRNAILGPVVVMTPTTASPAGDKEGVCLPLDFVPGYLFTIDASRVAEDVRPKVLDYQRSCFRVLADACLRPVAPPRPALAGPARATAGTFPAWPLDELRAKRNLVETSRMLDGVDGARWMAEQLGFPRPPASAFRSAAAPLRGPVEAWWHERLRAGATRRTADLWEREVAVEALFADYCVSVGEGGPGADMLRTAWAARLHRLLPTIRKRRSRDTGGARPRLYVLPPLGEARALYCAVTGEASTWDA